MSPHLELVRQKAERLTRDFTAEDWRCARQGKWCASGILEHLMLAFSATTKGTLKTLKASEPYCREVTWRDRIARFYVVELGIFPKGMQAPKQTVPTEVRLDEPLRRFNDALVAMDATLTDAERRFGKKMRILDHPVLGPLTAEDWRRFHRVHAYHHFAHIAVQHLSAHSVRASA